MPPKDGYVQCGQTLLGGQCSVSCAAGYSGAGTMYTCALVNGAPTFQPQGTVATCELIKYALLDQCEPAVCKERWYLNMSSYDL